MRNNLSIQFQFAASALLAASLLMAAPWGNAQDAEVVKPPSFPGQPKGNLTQLPSPSNKTYDAPPAFKEDRQYWEFRVMQRAKARLALVADKKYADAYDFLSPASKQTVKRERYADGLAARPIEAPELFSVKCNDDFCESSAYVKVKIEIPRVPARGVFTTLADRWVISNGEAWLLLN